MNVLLVEDDFRIAELYKLSLESEGCSVWLAHEGNEAINIASSTSIDLIVTDLMIPGLSGAELIRRVRNLHPEMPIVALTNLGSGEQINSLKDTEGVEILMKVHTGPEEIHELIAKYR